MVDNRVNGRKLGVKYLITQGFTVNGDESDDELIKLIVKSLKNNMTGNVPDTYGCTPYILRVKGNILYYFDNKWKVRAFDSGNPMARINLENCASYVFAKDDHYRECLQYREDNRIKSGFDGYNRRLCNEYMVKIDRVWVTARSKFSTNMSIEECVRIYLNTELSNGTRSPDFLDIYKVPYNRVSDPYMLNDIFYDVDKLYVGRDGDRTVGTFDWISLDIAVIQSYDRRNTYKILKKNKKDLIQIAFHILSVSDTFNNFGVPVDQLRITDMEFTSDWLLSFKFERRKA